MMVRHIHGAGSKRILTIAGVLLILFLVGSCEKIEPKSELVFRTVLVKEFGSDQYEITGTVINIGKSPILQHGFCFSEQENPTTGDAHTELGTLDEAGTFTSIIREIPWNVRIYIRAYMTTEEGTSYGNQLHLDTPPPPLPEVITGATGRITESSIECGGTVVSDGGEPVIARGVCWSTEPEPTIDGPHSEDGAGLGEFPSLISGLDCSTVFYVRAYATNAFGTSYGDQVEIGTLPCKPEEAAFIFSDRDGLWLLNHEGTRSMFLELSGRGVEVYNNRIYVHWGLNVEVYSLDANLLRTISLDSRIPSPAGLVVLAGENMAVLDNSSDSVYFTNSAGELLASVSMTGDPPGGNLQIVNGIVVGNSLIVSEDGNSNVVRFDLSNYKRSVLKSFDHLPGWLGDIAYWEGRFYVAKWNTIHQFIDDSEMVVATMPEGNNVGMAVKGNFAYVTSNFGNKIYRANLRDGSLEVLIDDANYPQDIELIE